MSNLNAKSINVGRLNVTENVMYHKGRIFDFASAAAGPVWDTSGSDIYYNTGNVSIGKALDVSGNITTSGSLDVSGNITTSGSLDVSGNIDVCGNIAIGTGHGIKMNLLAAAGTATINPPTPGNCETTGYCGKIKLSGSLTNGQQGFFTWTNSVLKSDSVVLLQYHTSFTAATDDKAKVIVTYVTDGTTKQIYLYNSSASTINFSTDYINYFIVNQTDSQDVFSNLSFTSTINLANTADVGYTLSSTLSNGTITYTRTSGEADSGSPHTVNLTGSELIQGTFLGELTNAPPLVVGTTYDLTFNGTTSGGDVAVPVTLTGTIPFGQFGGNYHIAQWGNLTIRAENALTESLWNQMRVAFNNGNTVKLEVVSGTPYHEQGGTPLTLAQHITDSTNSPGATVTGAGGVGGSGTPNHIKFAAYFGSSYAYNQLQNATFLVKIT